MAFNDIVAIRRGRPDGDYAGRTFVRLAGYQREAQEVLESAGATFMGSHLLPESLSDTEMDGLIQRAKDAAERDRARVKRERIPVRQDRVTKENIQVGRNFDFEGDIGVAPVVAIGKPFRPKVGSPHDDRIKPLIGYWVVYLYNTVPEPRSKTDAKKQEDQAQGETAGEAASSKDDGAQTPSTSETETDTRAAMLDTDPETADVVISPATRHRDRSKVLIAPEWALAGQTVMKDGRPAVIVSIGKKIRIGNERKLREMRARFPDTDEHVCGRNGKSPVQLDGVVMLATVTFDVESEEGDPT